MQVSASRKNKVILTDYNFRRDIENRLQLAQLSVFDVEVLNEVLNSSLTFPVADLVETLSVSHSDVVSTLDKLIATKLLQHDGRMVRVDKEMRKYYEFQIQKFDDDFAPDIEYIIKGLKRIPIHVLPNWYSIPRTTDDIFVSIIEKHFLTPKIYDRHLKDLVFDDPIPLAIMKDVFAADDFKVRSKTLRDKYNLSREQFEEYMLLLELNFACYLSYSEVDGMWKEVATPMHEWREFLRFQRDTEPKTVSEDQVSPFHGGGGFAFVQDITALVRILDQQPLKVEGELPDVTLSHMALALWAPSLSCRVDREAVAYLKSLVKRLLQLKLAEVRDGHLYGTLSGSAWVRRSPQDQAMLVYRLPVSSEDFPGVSPDRFTEKNIRSVERSLKRVMKSGWVTFDDFMKGMIEPFGDAEYVTLRQKGKRWSYVIPTYVEADYVFIRELILQRFFQVGIVSVGHHQGTACFTVTHFGRIALGDLERKG
jgi:predicted transcriptional regulator